jgi:ribose transport system substrate-binding protein
MTIWSGLGFALLAGCGGDASTRADKLKLAVIPKGTTHEFWKSVYYGAVQAGDELGVEIIWKGPAKEGNREEQITIVNNYVTRKVDGICLAPLDSRGLVDAVEAAKLAGIPTVIFDSGLERPELTVSYVATDNYNGGALAARELGRLLQGTGKIILLRYAEGSESTEQRENGFLDTVKKEFPNLELISSDLHAGDTADSALDVSQQLLNKYKDQVEGIFAVNESAATGMWQALRNAGLAGKVKFIGFDTSARLIEGMRAGEIHALVLQDPVKMGRMAVTTLVNKLRGESVEPRISTGEILATPQNLDLPEIAARLRPPRKE